MFSGSDSGGWGHPGVRAARSRTHSNLAGGLRRAGWRCSRDLSRRLRTALAVGVTAAGQRADHEPPPPVPSAAEAASSAAAGKPIAPYSRSAVRCGTHGTRSATGARPRLRAEHMAAASTPRPSPPAPAASPPPARGRTRKTALRSHSHLWSHPRSARASTLSFRRARTLRTPRCG
jgi:hypothetical protein